MPASLHSNERSIDEARSMNGKVLSRVVQVVKCGWTRARMIIGFAIGMSGHGNNTITLTHAHTHAHVPRAADLCL